MFRNIGAMVCSGWRSVYPVAQLYYACKLHRDLRRGSKLLSEKKSAVAGPDFPEEWTETDLCWNEMEKLLKWFGVDYFFSNTVPRSNYDLRNSHGLFDESTPKKRKERIRKVPVQKSMYDPFMEAPKLGESELEQYDAGNDFCNYEHISVSHRLHISKYQRRSQDQMSAITWTQENLHALLQRQLDRTDRESGGGTVATTSQARYQLSSQVGLLRALKTSLVGENEALCFDYLAFHVYCLKLLRILQRVISVRSTEVSSICSPSEGQDADLISLFPFHTTARRGRLRRPHRAPHQ